MKKRSNKLNVMKLKFEQMGDEKKMVWWEKIRK